MISLIYLLDSYWVYFSNTTISVLRHKIIMKNDLNPFAFFLGNGIGRPFFVGIFDDQLFIECHQRRTSSF